MPHAKESLPHWEYWRELPGLVKDGCIYSFQQSKLAAQRVHKWYVGDEPLREGLKAAEEGSTSDEQYKRHDAGPSASE